ncbi:MAG: AmmeMemoRadiSam system protein B [bacterium]
MIRKPVVTGLFYPGEKEELNTMIDGFLSRAFKKVKSEKYRGIIAPHAGYVYSGQAQAFSYTAAIPARAVILGVNHRGLGEQVALFGKGEWAVPNGQLKCDDEVGEMLLTEMPSLRIDPRAHSQEHSIEVQVPFLIRRNPAVLITPVSMYDYSVETARTLGAAIAEVLKKFPETIIIASSDFTHYEPAETAGKQDSLAGEKILAMDPDGLHGAVKNNSITLCGLGPIMTLLFAIPGGKAKKIFYDTSATASGDSSSVVGYASYGIK